VCERKRKSVEENKSVVIVGFLGALMSLAGRHLYNAAHIIDLLRLVTSTCFAIYYRSYNLSMNISLGKDD